VTPGLQGAGDGRTIALFVRAGAFGLEAQAEPIAGVVCQIHSIARGEWVERICNPNSVLVIHCDRP
jgi:hypothetical protein